MSLLHPSPSWLFLDLAAPIVEHATNYAAAGFRVFPLRPNKTPYVKAYHDTATQDPAQIEQWWRQWPDALIGHAIDPEMVVLDVDPKHGGDATWAAMRAEFGDIDSGMSHLSGRGDGGAHHWYVRPDVRLDMTRLDAWAEARNVGAPINGVWKSGIDLLTSNHRYTILPPSRHPDTRLPYRWAGFGEAATFTTAMLDVLRHVEPERQPAPVVVTPPRTTTASPSSDDETPAEFYSRTRTWADVFGPLGYTVVSGDGEQEGSKWRHPQATNDWSITVGPRSAVAFNFTPNVPMPVTSEGHPRGVTKFYAYAHLHHRGDVTAAATEVRRTMMPQQHREYHVPTLLPPSWRPETAEAPRTAAPSIDEAFWNARPVLAHIRDAARSRLVAPAAVLGTVLARVAAFTPPSTCLPPIIGGYSPLSLYVALYGQSGAGKSAPTAVAAALLPHVPGGCVGPLALGSGEGLVEAFMDLVEEEGDDGKKRKVKRQVHHGALFMLDEGQLLGDLASRKGASILSVLRTAWSGGDPGQANASIETRRSLKAGSYHVGLVSLWQAKAAATLLADTDGGTPQRFVWLPTTDPGMSVDGPAWPGSLDWAPPPAIQSRGVFAPHPLDVDPAIVAEVKAAHVAKMNFGDDGDPLDAHRNLNRLKIAGVLAVLDRRLQVTPDDWHLAGQVLATSDAIRGWVLGEVRRQEQSVRLADVTRHAERAVAAETAAHSAALARAAKAAWRAAHAAAENGTKASHRDVHRAIAGRDRKVVSVEEAIEEAQRLGWLDEGNADYGWAVGKSRPA